MELIEKAKRIELLSGKLGLMIPIPYLHIEHRDKDGVLYPDGDYYNVAQSWVRNAYNHILSRISGYYPRDTGNFGTGYISYKDTGGTIRTDTGRSFTYYSQQDDTVDLESMDGGYMRAAGSNSRGIRAGIGTNAESFEDYEVQTIIAHGTGSGQLSYGAMSRAESDNGLTHKHSLSRILTHLGNGQPNIVVTEVGMAMLLYDETTPYNILMLRDLLDASATMTYLDTLTVTYEITLTYPS